MATYRNRRSSNGASSFADLEDQHRQEAQRQIQSVSRESNVNTSRAEQTMNNIIEQQNREALNEQRSVTRSGRRLGNDANQLKEDIVEGLRDMTDADKRGSGKVGDDLLSEIAAGQSLETLEHQQRMQDLHDNLKTTGEMAEDAANYGVMGGKQLIRGSAQELNRIFNEAEQGYMDWYQSSPENSYMQYAARNMNDPNADMTNMNAGVDIQRQAQENFDAYRNGWRNALRKKADSASDEELFTLYMAQNPDADPNSFNADEMRNLIRDEAEAGSEDFYNNLYNSLENELSYTTGGQILESVGSQATRGILAQAVGLGLGELGIGLPVGIDPVKDPEAYQIAYQKAIDAMTGRASLGMMGYGIAGSETGQKIEEGYDPDRALAYGLAQAGVELGTEKMGDVAGWIGDKTGVDLSGLFNNVTAGQARGLQESFSEYPEEFVGQMLDPLTQKILDPDMTWGDVARQTFSKENIAAANQAGLQGALSAGLTSFVTNPTQTAQMYAEDIQNLRNLPQELNRDLTQISNKINKTNEYQKELDRSLVTQRESELEMMPEGEDKERIRQEIQADKEALQWKYIGANGENLYSDSPLVREAAEAANNARFSDEANVAGFRSQDTDILSHIQTKTKQTFNAKSENQFNSDYGAYTDGVFDGETGNITISSSAKDSSAGVGFHEVGHGLEGTDEWNNFVRYASEALDAGKMNVELKGQPLKSTRQLDASIVKEYIVDFLQGQEKADYRALSEEYRNAKDGSEAKREALRKINEFLEQDHIREIIATKEFQAKLFSERGAFLAQAIGGTQEAVDYVTGKNRNAVQKVYEGLQEFVAKVADNQEQLAAIDSKKSIRKALNLFDTALQRDQQLTREAIAQVDRMIQRASEETKQSRSLDLSEESVDDKIRNSMSMKEARRMLEKTWNQYKDYYDAKTLDEFIEEDPDYAVSELATLIENNYGLQNEYINSNDDILNEEYMIEDVVQAYVDGNLKDESKSYKLKDTQFKEGAQQTETFFTPKTIKDAERLFQVASQRVTKANEAEVYRARADLIVFAHNADAESTLGLTRSELNKKIRSWSRYSAQARQISERLNAGVPEQYRWSGLENSNNINQYLLANGTNIKNEISELVKEVKGDYDDNATRNIIDVMLALDSHINYKDLTIDFAYGKKLGQNGRANGEYDHLDTTITISSGARHTVAHETGHFLDNLWGREISEYRNEARNMYLSDLSLLSEFRTGNQDLDAFIENFRTFIDKLATKNDIRNGYTQTRTEIFARFCDYFVGWVNKTAGGYEYGGGFYNDNFTAADCADFVKLLQQKSMLNATVLAESTTEEQNVKFSRQLDTSYMQAVESGDTETAERYVEQAAKRWGAYSDENGNPIKMYHGTHSFGFTKFNTKWVFLSDDVNTASTYSSGDNRRTIADRMNENIDLRTPEGILKALEKYGDPEETFTYDAARKKFIRNDGYEFDIWPIRNYAEERVDTKQDRGIYSLYSKIENPLVIDGNGAFWKNIPAPKELLSDIKDYMSGMMAGGDAFSTEQYALYAEDRGYGGVVFNNISDNGMTNMNAGKVNGNVYVVFDPANVKSADAVTYEDGEVIPLSERFSDSTDLRYSRNLTLDEDLAKVNPYMSEQYGRKSDPTKMKSSEKRIDTSKIPAGVLSKAMEDNNFSKIWNKKGKTYADMAFLGNGLRTAQQTVDRENVQYRGEQAFGETQYEGILKRLTEAGVNRPADVIDYYLSNIDYKGTQKADEWLKDDPNASLIMKEIKGNIRPEFIQELVDRQNASNRKRQKTINEQKVPGTEAYWRKVLKDNKETVKTRISEIIPQMASEIDIEGNRLSPMAIQRDYGIRDLHSPIGEARNILRQSGITSTGEYSDFLKQIFAEALDGQTHDASMLSRFKDSVLSNEQLANDSDMAKGGFEYMVEQLDKAADKYKRVESEYQTYESFGDMVSDAMYHPAAVPLTENDHMDETTKLRISYMMGGMAANDPAFLNKIRQVEALAREISEDERYDENGNSRDLYWNRFNELGLGEMGHTAVNMALHDMKLAHGRNNGFEYVPAPSQGEINKLTAERKARTAANTRAFLENRASQNEAVTEAARDEAIERVQNAPVPDAELPQYDINSTALGEENYQWPSDSDAPWQQQAWELDENVGITGQNEPFSYEDYYQRIYEGDDYQVLPDDYQFPTDKDAPPEPKRSPLDLGNIALRDEYDEATRDIDKGMNYIAPADYTPGKLESERTDDDRSESRKAAAAMRDDIDTVTSVGQNVGSTSQTIQQNNDQVAKGNKEVRQALKRIVEDPFYEAKRKMFIHYKENVKKLNQVIKEYGIKEGSEESAAMQWFMEGTKDTNAENQLEVRYGLEELKRDFPEKWEDIQKASEILKEMYDDYYVKINEAMEMIYPEKALIEEAARQRKMLDTQLEDKQARLREMIREGASRSEINEYRRQIRELAKKYNTVDRDVRIQKRLPLREHYVHHFQDVKPTLANIYGAFKDVINNTGSNNISNQYADTSEYNQPNARWWGSMMQRNNGEYTADAIGGMLRYMDRAEQKIFIDPYSAYMRGVIREFKNSADENQTDMSSFIRYYSAWVNDLTGKTNPYDRMLNYAFNGKGRQVITLMKLLNSRIKSNAVMGNLNSAIAQFYNLPNGIAVLREHGGADATEDWIKGLNEYMRAKTTNDLDSAASQSVFLLERYFDNFTNPLMDFSTPQKFTNWMMQFGDRAVAEQIWYAAKAQGERLGVDNPIQYADELTARSVAGRGIGEVPITQKAELTKLLAPFQVEVNNQWQTMKHLVGEKQASALLGMFISAFLMNAVKRKVTGTEGTGFDPIAAIVDAFRDNEGFGDTASAIAMNLTGEVISNMPFGALLAEFMGMASDSYSSYFGEHDPTRYGIGNIGMAGLMKPLLQVLSGDADKVDWTKLVTNYGLPYGGRQAERTIKTLQDMGYLPHFGNGVYGFKEGAYTSSGKLKYMIDKDSIPDILRSLLFGTYASEGGQEYLENRTALGESSTNVLNTLVDYGADSYDTWQAMRSLKEVEYPAGVTNAKGLATRKALEDAGLWDEWSEAYMNMEEDAQESFRSGTNGIGKKVAAMDEDEFQRAYDEIFGTSSSEVADTSSVQESVPTATESPTMTPSRQQAYDTVTSADIGVDSEQLSETMSSLESRNLTDADGNKIDNSRSAVNRLAYEEDGSYQTIIDYIESEENQNSDDPLTYSDFGLSKSVVQMNDDEYEELLSQINEGTGSSYRRRRSGSSSRTNNRTSNVFQRSGTSAVRSLGTQHNSTYIPKKKGSYTRDRSTVKRLQAKTKALSDGIYDQDLYDQIFK